MTGRRTRLERLEAQLQAQAGAEGALDFYGADLQRGVWVGLHTGWELPMSEEEEAQANETGGAFLILGARGYRKAVYGVDADAL